MIVTRKAWDELQKKINDLQHEIWSRDEWQRTREAKKDAESLQKEIDELKAKLAKLEGK